MHNATLSNAPKQLDVLLIDDDHLLCEMAPHTAARVNISLSIARCATSAREALGRKFDAILLDLGMHGNDEAGLSILRWLRGSASCNQHTAVVIFTHSTEARHPSLAMKAGAQGFLSKSAFTAQAMRGCLELAIAQEYALVAPLASATPSQRGHVIATLRTLSARRALAARLMLECKSEEEIAEIMQIQRSSVRDYTRPVIKALRDYGISSSNTFRHLLASAAIGPGDF